MPAPRSCICSNRLTETIQGNRRILEVPVIFNLERPSYHKREYPKTYFKHQIMAGHA